MTESSAAETKASVRRELRSARIGRSTSVEESSRLSEQLGQFCLDNKVSVAAAYLPLAHEPDISEFLGWAKLKGIKLLMPVVTGQNLRWVEHGSETRIGELGFEEASGKAAELSSADVIFVPALAVDFSGNRLGQGKGYYDRTLQSLGSSKRRAKLVAVVFDEEVKLSLPSEEHDEKVDAAITASKIVWFRR
jgi:5-formyltetrahydrofolate cyclo-ligase